MWLLSHVGGSPPDVNPGAVLLALNLMGRWAAAIDSHRDGP